MSSRKEFISNTATDKSGNKFKLLSAFSSQTEEIKMRCVNCDHIFTKVLQGITAQKMFCPECKRNFNRTKSDEAYKRKFYNKFGSDYEILDVYKNQNEKIRIKHKTCGRVDERYPTAVYRSSIPCLNKKCRDKNAKVDIFGLSIKNFADIIKGSIVPKDKINGKYIQTAYDEFDLLEKHYCKKGHACHVPVNYTYKELTCPFCLVLSSEEYKEFESKISSKIMNGEILDRPTSELDRRSA